MWPNWSLQTAGWQRWFEHLCTFENMRWILEGWYWRREKFYYENKEKEKKGMRHCWQTLRPVDFFFRQLKNEKILSSKNKKHIAQSEWKADSDGMHVMEWIIRSKTWGIEILHY